MVLDTGYDIHLVGKSAIPGSRNPTTSVGQSFIAANNIPFAMLVPTSWQYPEAGVFIGDAYPQFEDWRRSLGANNPDWYNFSGAGVRTYTFVMPE